MKKNCPCGDSNRRPQFRWIRLIRLTDSLNLKSIERNTKIEHETEEQTQNKRRAQKKKNCEFFSVDEEGFPRRCQAEGDPLIRSISRLCHWLPLDQWARCVGTTQRIGFCNALVTDWNSQFGAFNGHWNDRNGSWSKAGFALDTPISLSKRFERHWIR